jgi:hypothetical protein
MAVDGVRASGWKSVLSGFFIFHPVESPSEWSVAHPATGIRLTLKSLRTRDEADQWARWWLDGYQTLTPAEESRRKQHEERLAELEQRRREEDAKRVEEARKRAAEEEIRRAEMAKVHAERRRRMEEEAKQRRIVGWLIAAAIAGMIGWFYLNEQQQPDPSRYNFGPGYENPAPGNDGSVDCAPGQGPIFVGSSDPAGLDGDGDGVGCE